MTETIKILVAEHKLIRRLLLAWIMVLISFATYTLFIDPKSINGAAAAAYASLLGLMGVVGGLYGWQRMKETMNV